MHLSNLSEFDFAITCGRWCNLGGLDGWLRDDGAFFVPEATGGVQVLIKTAGAEPKPAQSPNPLTCETLLNQGYFDPATLAVGDRVAMISPTGDRMDGIVVMPPKPQGYLRTAVFCWVQFEGLDEPLEIRKKVLTVLERKMSKAVEGRSLKSTGSIQALN